MICWSIIHLWRLVCTSSVFSRCLLYVWSSTVSYTAKTLKYTNNSKDKWLILASMTTNSWKLIISFQDGLGKFKDSVQCKSWARWNWKEWGVGGNWNVGKDMSKVWRRGNSGSKREGREETIDLGKRIPERLLREKKENERFSLIAYGELILKEAYLLF